jgi:hypothetical protein
VNWGVIVRGFLNLGWNLAPLIFPLIILYIERARVNRYSFRTLSKKIR